MSNAGEGFVSDVPKGAKGAKGIPRRRRSPVVMVLISGSSPIHPQYRELGGFGGQWETGAVNPPQNTRRGTSPPYTATTALCCILRELLRSKAHPILAVLESPDSPRLIYLNKPILHLIKTLFIHDSRVTYHQLAGFIESLSLLHRIIYLLRVFTHQEQQWPPIPTTPLTPVSPRLLSRTDMRTAITS
jgi:hypothetical protein